MFSDINNPTVKDFYKLSTLDTLTELNSNHNGLCKIESSKRLEIFGENLIEKTKQTSILKLLLDQFRNFLIILLLFAVAISALIGHVVDAIAILIIVLFSIVLGFIQEYKADNAIEALRSITAPTARVKREGEIIEIPSREVVPGDILILTMGDKIPADARVIEAINLQTDEASLTGESLPVSKISSEIKSDNLALGDRINLIYAGTVVTYGRGTAVVTDTGMFTEFGKIATELSSIQSSHTPLQKNFDRLGKKLSIFAIIIISILFVIGILQNHDPLVMFIWSIAIAVAVVPEALPAVITISLALGVQKMSKKNALIRKLPAVETLGATSIILTDKTGTLTEGKMAVKEFYLGINQVTNDDNSSSLTRDHLVLQGMYLCNDAHWNKGEYIGNPTDIGLKEFSARFGFDDNFVELHPRIDEIPFSSDRKMMTTVHKFENHNIMFTKGAPEVIFNRSKYMFENGNLIILNEEIRKRMDKIVDEMANNSLRTIAIAYKQINDEKLISEDNLILLGYVGLNDPPRKGVKDAIKESQNAGIKIIMLTGDHLKTATSIGKEIGIAKDGKVLTGLELDLMSDEELLDSIEKIDVIARVSPSHKLRIVNLVKQRKQVVAMTGDGINDAPALKSADVGIAMGITGTDVSKEAADMILADDNFNTIVTAIYEGRMIFENIKKYLMFLLSSNLGEILLLGVAVLLGWNLPLIAIQILYVNLATDGLPALALAVDPPIRSKMQDPPRDPSKSIISKSVLNLIIVGGLWSGLVNLSLFYYFFFVEEMGLAFTQGLVFINLIVIQFVKAYNYRSDKYSLSKYKPFSNKWLNRAVFWEFILLLFIIYNSTLQSIMGTHSLSFTEWMIVIISALSIIPILETSKWFIRKKENYS